MGLPTTMIRIAAKTDLFERMMATLDVRDRLGRLQGGGDALRDAAAQCRSCGDPDACRAWLASHGSAEEAPGFCRNHDLFARLREHAKGHAD